MRHPQKILAASALVAVVLGGIAAPAAVAENHPPSPGENHGTLAPLEHHGTVVPLENHGTLAPPDRNQDVTPQR
ncbi:hypothetical protein [Streptomyces sp. G45]|uniref:hypothetical protein n=1 Tax=Streptomyces sp. G45 TaxID=3406627 RepID=UPI003C2197EC